MALVDYRLAETMELPDGRTVEWETIGDGPPLMWVEGGPGLWAHQARPEAELMSNMFRCHLVNAPGCGRTTRPTDMNAYGLTEIIAFFDAVRQRLGLEQVTVMGHSWGGLVAAAWALAHPESVERLVIIDGYAGERLDGLNPDEIRLESERCLQRHANAPWYEEAMHALALGDELDMTGNEELWLAGYRPMWALYFADPESARSAPLLKQFRDEMRYNLDMTCAWTQPPHNFDDVSILESLGAVRCPSLVVAGEYDFICGPAWNRPIAAAIPGARYVEIPGAGHMPQWEQPDAFKSALAGWMSR